MRMITVEAVGKKHDLIKVESAGELEYVLGYIEELTKQEFWQFKGMDERGLTHNTWLSPISALSTRLCAMLGGSVVDHLLKVESDYLTAARNIFKENGALIFSSSFGYSPGEFAGNTIKDIEISSIPEFDSISLNLSNTNLVVENDKTVDTKLINFLSKHGLSYSTITNLRHVHQQGKLVPAIGAIRRTGKINLYVCTSGYDVTQIEEMLRLFSRYCLEINVMTDEKNEILLSKCIEEYPSIVFNRLPA